MFGSGRSSPPSSLSFYGEPDQLLSDQFLEENCLRVVEALHHQPSPTPRKAMDLKLNNCRKFSGLSTDNASRFLSDFESYAEIFDLVDSVRDRRVPAFHLLLQGPALVWFNSLSTHQKCSWETVYKLFVKKYINLDLSSSTLLLGTEHFNRMLLSAGEPLEDFQARLAEKGSSIGKSEMEILNKFISCLPEQLAFFVRAGNPKDCATAVEAAKLGEAYGYRDHPPSISSIFPQPNHQKPAQPNSDIEELKLQVAQLTDIVTKTFTDRGACSSTGNSVATSRSNPTPRLTCFRCQSDGHIQRKCNWNGNGVPTPKVQCQLCSQFGHPALFCSTLTGNSPRPGSTRHAFPGY